MRLRGHARRPPDPAEGLDQDGGALDGRTWAAVLAACRLPDGAVADLAELAGAAQQDLADLLDRRPLLPGPTFAQSQALGGADADLIAGRELVEIKAGASSSSIARRETIWQVVGYALADTDDRYSIDTVTVAVLRWRQRVSWGLPELLEALSGSRRPVESWRAEFADAVAGAAPRRRRPSPGPLVRPPAAS